MTLNLVFTTTLAMNKHCVINTRFLRKMKSKSSIKVGCLQKRTLRLFQISSWAGGTWTVLVMKGWPLGMSTSSINIVKLCLLNRTLTWPKADFSKFQIMIFLWKEIYNETILCRTNVLISLSDVWDRCYPMMKQPANKKKKIKTRQMTLLSTLKTDIRGFRISAIVNDRQ